MAAEDSEATEAAADSAEIGAVEVSVAEAVLAALTEEEAHQEAVAHSKDDEHLSQLNECEVLKLSRLGINQLLPHLLQEFLDLLRIVAHHF